MFRVQGLGSGGLSRLGFRVWGQEDFVSRLIIPITHMVTLSILVIELTC